MISGEIGWLNLSVLLLTKVDTIGSAMIRTKVDIRVQGIECLKSRVLCWSYWVTPIESQQNNAPARHAHEAVELLQNSLLLTCGCSATRMLIRWLPHLGSDTGMRLALQGYTSLWVMILVRFAIYVRHYQRNHQTVKLRWSLQLIYERSRQICYFSIIFTVRRYA